MKTKIYWLFFAFVFLFGCGVQTPHPNSGNQFCPVQINPQGYASRVDSFVIIFDASSSMAESYGDTTLFDLGKSILAGINTTLPELGQTAGLRSFGHDPSVSVKNTERLYGMTEYDSGAFADQAYLIAKPGGSGTVVQATIAAFRDDLKCTATDHNALIIISDGKQGLDQAGMDEIREAAQSASACIYPIQVGHDPQARNALMELANLGDCGFLSNADDLNNEPAMTEFVKKVFLEKRRLVPTSTKPATPVVKTGDDIRFTQNVLFDFDKAKIKIEAYPFLSQVVQALREHPEKSVLLGGHTDYIGAEAYNKTLSLKRAQAVAAYLEAQGIARNRLIIKGFGFSHPASTNATPSGRALNRRVEIHPR